MQRASVVAQQGDRPRRPRPDVPLKRPALTLLSGLIGGLALGLVVVILQAILSDRLWLRIEVASALDTPVPLSVRRLAPLSWFWRTLDFLPRVAAAHGALGGPAADGGRPRAGDPRPWSASGSGRRSAWGTPRKCGSVSSLPRALQRTGVGGARRGSDERRCRQPRAAAPRRPVGAGNARTCSVPSVVPSLTRGPGRPRRRRLGRRGGGEGPQRRHPRSSPTSTPPSVSTIWPPGRTTSSSPSPRAVQRRARAHGRRPRSVPWGSTCAGAVLLRAVRDDMSSGRGLPEGEVDLGVSRAAAPPVDSGVERSLLP